MSTCSVYKHVKLLGTGSITNGATSITGWSSSGALSPMVGRNVWVSITSSTHAGQTFQTKVTAEGASLTIRDANPYAT